MPLEGLSNKLENVFKRLRSKGVLSESDVKSAMREVRLALIDADVNYRVAKDFTVRLTEKCVGEKVMESLTPAQMVIKIVRDELTSLMGGERVKLKTATRIPTVILMCGLQGAGKTTHCAKLAKKLKSEGHRPLLVACDIYRPAAIEQLKIVGSSAGVHVFEMGTTEPEKIAEAAVRHARDYGNDFVILDTAGRLHIDDELMDELKRICEVIEVNNVILVVDAMIGQDAVNVAKAFNDLLEIDGTILTKLDGDTRGGAALSLREITGKPILYVGVGEKLDDLDEFYPDRMASRILGMGDVMSLIEKAENEFDVKQAQKTVKRLAENKFDMNDLLQQFESIKKMGPLKNVMAMMPGVNSKLKNIEVDDRQLLRMEAIIKSMTYKERATPNIINASRKIRIAAGSGMRVEDVNRLLKQYEQIKKLFKQNIGKGSRTKFRKGMDISQGFNF